MIQNLDRLKPSEKESDALRSLGGSSEGDASETLKGETLKVVRTLDSIKKDEPSGKETLIQDPLASIGSQIREVNFDWEALEETARDDFYQNLVSMEDSLDSLTLESGTFTDFLFALSQNLPEQEGGNLFSKYEESKDARLWFAENQETLAGLSSKESLLAFQGWIQSHGGVNQGLNSQEVESVRRVHFTSPKPFIVEDSE